MLFRSVEGDVADLYNLRTMQIVPISADQAIGYTADPVTTRQKNDGFEYGFVILTAQIFLDSLNVRVEPIDAQTRNRLEAEWIKSLTK